jgi:hypothetical protein
MTVFSLFPATPHGWAIGEGFLIHLFVGSREGRSSEGMDALIPLISL